MLNRNWSWKCLELVAAIALVVSGCSPAPSPKTTSEKDSGKNASEGPKVAPKGEGHIGWCDGHGVPEDECSQCIPEVEKKCKAKGDWCAEHNRAKSQCFVCNPKLKEKFAAVYRAQYGKEPPLTDEEKAEQKKNKEK